MIPTLTIRADCSPTIGTGHVMRMIALGQAWRTLGGRVQFIGQTAPLTSRLESEGFAIIEDESGDDARRNADILLYKTSASDWIVLDGYGFDIDLQKELRQAGRKVILVDDVNNRSSYEADILLNQNLDANTYEYNINDDALLLLGNEYILIRNEFLTSTTSQQPSHDALHLLITMGGADPAQMTGPIIKALEAIDHKNLHVKVLAGASNPMIEELKELVSDSRHNCELIPSVDDMPSLLNWTDAAISAAGSTCWELCMFGIPFIAIQIANNQEGVVNELDKRDIALCLKKSEADHELSTTLNALISDSELREKLRANTQSLVDGKGAMRTAKAIVGADISLRPATMADCETILEWRNHPTVRANSFNSEVIELAGHQAWFTKKLQDADCLYFMAITGADTPVGQFRFDMEDNAGTVSLSVNPELTGLSIGTTMTRLACSKLKEIKPEAIAVALVKPENIASSIMFEKAGFTKDENHDGDHLRYIWPGNDNDK